MTDGDVDLSDVRNALRELQDAQSALGARSSEIAAAVKTVGEELRQLRDRFEFVARSIEQQQNVLIANLQIVTIRQELAKRFGHYVEIRELAKGILQAMDAGTVTHESIQQLSEQKMLIAPGYWLGGALVGLAAWIRDDRILAERAMEAALKRADYKTSLFYALVLARQRPDRQTGWLLRALRGPEPTALPREFAVILDAAVSNVLGPATRPDAVDHLIKWFERLSGDPRAVSVQVDRWRTFLLGLRSPCGEEFAAEFGALRTRSPSWPELVDVYEQATVFGLVRRRFLDLGDQRGRPPVELHEKVDGILHDLVSNYDDDESPWRDQLAALEEIVAARGDEEVAARAQAVRAAAGGDTVDFLTLITNSALNLDGRVAAETRRVCLALAKEWIHEAVDGLASTNQGRVPDSIEITYGPWTGRVSRDIELKDAARTAQQVIDADTAARVGAERLGSEGNAAVAGAGVGVAFGALAGIQHVLGIVTALVFVLLGVASGWYGYGRFKLLWRRRDAVRLDGARLRREVPGAIAQVAEEFERWRDRWAREIAEVEPLRVDLEGLPDVDALLDAEQGHTVVRSRRGPASFRPTDRDPTRPGVHSERSRQRPNEDSSGRAVALRLPDWDLEPPPREIFRPDRPSN